MSVWFIHIGEIEMAKMTKAQKTKVEKVVKKVKGGPGVESPFAVATAVVKKGKGKKKSKK